MFLRTRLQYDLHPEALQQPQHGRRQADKADTTAMTPTTPRQRGAVTGPARIAQATPMTTWVVGGAGRAALRDHSKGGGRRATKRKGLWGYDRHLVTGSSPLAMSRHN
jgi:hypothetical protein